MTHPGTEDPDKIYYLIRPASKTEGLCSLFFSYGVREVVWAKEKGYIPYIDFETENCQYYTGEKINGSSNAWNFFFEQPERISREDVLNKKNVLLSGWTARNESLNLTVESVTKEPISSACHKLCRVQKRIWNSVYKKRSELMPDGKTLGIYARGTDYTALKPRGHYRQPSTDEIIEKIKEFKKKYPIERILVVTEDHDIYQKIYDEFPKNVFSCDDQWIDKYEKSDFLSVSFTNDGYQRGKNYLIRLLMLSQCDYLIAGITNGSLFTLAEKEEKYMDQFFFDLGKY